MTSSPGTRRRAVSLMAPLGLVLGLGAACAAPQPDACAAYLACFFPEGESSPYRDVSGADCSDESTPSALCQAELAAQGDEARAFYGPEGECWRSGTDDPLYKTCVMVCAAALREECQIAKSGGPREAYCVVGDGNARRFEPPSDASLSLSCTELESL